jgi:hypothetical protein
MNPLVASTATLAVSIIFCVWQAYIQTLQRRERQLRHRVAYMLWTAAKHNG